MKPVGKKPEPGGLRFPAPMQPQTAQWFYSLERAAMDLVQHTYSDRNGFITLGEVARTDLVAVRREDWKRLSEVLNGGL